MRRFLLAVIVAVLLACLAAVPAHAAEPATIDLWVEVKGGGTAVISTETNSPLPKETHLTLASGELGAFQLTFDNVGEYSYKVQIEPDERDLNFDDTVYLVGIYVTDEDGELLVNVVMSRYGDAGKYTPSTSDSAHALKVQFDNSAGGEPTPVDPSNPTDPNNPINPVNPTNPTNPSNPSNPNDPNNQTNPASTVNPSGPGNPVNPVQPAGTESQGSGIFGFAPAMGDLTLPAWISGVLLIAALIVLLVARKLAAKTSNADEGRAMA